MFRILKVVLLLLFFVLLTHRLYFLYYGISNIITTVTIYTAVFLLIDFILQLITPLNWKKSNFRLTFWVLLLCVLTAEFTLKYYLHRNTIRTENTFLGNYYSPYRNILLENKKRLKGILDADIGIRLHPPYSEKIVANSEFSYEHQYNSYGLRSVEWSTQPLETAKVIMALGDSFTEGVGTPQDSTWIGLLPQKLDKEKTPAFALNAGYAGSDPFFEYYKLKTFLMPTFKPNVVVVAVNETDITDVLIRGGMERFVDKHTIKYKTPPWWEYWYAFSFITRYVVHDLQQKDWFFYTKTAFEKQKLVALEQISECLLQFKKLADEQDFKLIVLYLPMQHEVELNWDTFGATESILNKNEINVLNLLEAFQLIDADKLGDYYWLKDRHYNSKGYDFVAQQLADFMLTQLPAER
jgi:hypothetical protein